MSADNNSKESYRLAVVIPCWNRAEEIREMLCSIQAQTFQDWQVFCIDDGSTDHTLDVLKEFSVHDSRIHFLCRMRTPKGAQTCRNMGFDLSVGAEYVLFFDSDDIAAPHCFEQRIAFMDRHRELDFGIFPAKAFKTAPWDHTPRCFGFPLADDTMKAMLTFCLPMVGWTNIYRRSSLVRIHHQWDEQLLSMQDSDFNIHAMLQGLTFDYAFKEGAKIDYFYRMTDRQSVSYRICSEEHVSGHLHLLAKLVRSLSAEQKIKYKDSIEVYLFKFARMMKGQPQLFSRFLDNPWISVHPWFKYRMMLWRMSGFHLTYKVFFRDVHRREVECQREWKEAMRLSLKSIVYD